MSDEESGLLEKIDPIRTALLGIWTTILAIAFLAFLVADQAAAGLL